MARRHTAAIAERDDYASRRLVVVAALDVVGFSTIVEANEDNALARVYHRFLVWDMTTTSRSVRWVEKTLDPIIGKSLVLYTWKPSAARKETRVFAAA